MKAETDVVASQYKAWPYPEPLGDLSAAVSKEGYFDLSDPALFRRKLWPKAVEPTNLDILIAGCGTIQAAYYAFANPNCRVVGIDVSETSLAHQKYLKKKHGLKNLRLFRLNVEDVASLDRNFDLIVCSGVLHHLKDPDAGVRSLRDVLRPHGVMSLMLYGYYPRFGVYMLQEAFRLLGLKQDSAAIEAIRHALKALPKWHHAQSYMDIAPDLTADSGLVDTFLHRRDRAYTVPQVLQFTRDNGLKFQGWLDNLLYSISALMMQPDDLLRKQVEALPLSDQWSVVELLSQKLGTHRFLLCQIDRPETDYSLDFNGQAWLDYIPSLRPPIDIAINQRFQSMSSQVEPSATFISFKRDWHSFRLSRFEASLLGLTDGKTSIKEILLSEPLSAWSEARRSDLARKFFHRMADWDHLQFEIP